MIANSTLVTEMMVADTQVAAMYESGYLEEWQAKRLKRNLDDAWHAVEVIIALNHINRIYKDAQCFGYVA